MIGYVVLFTGAPSSFSIKVISHPMKPKPPLITATYLAILVACEKTEVQGLKGNRSNDSVTIVDPRLVPMASADTVAKRRQEISLIIRDIGSIDRSVILSAFSELWATVGDSLNANVDKLADLTFYQTLSLYAINSNDHELKAHVKKLMDAIAKSEQFVGREARLLLFNLNEAALSATSEAQVPPLATTTPLMTYWMNTKLRKQLSNDN
jgi:hypothetical protein